MITVRNNYKFVIFLLSVLILGFSVNSSNAQTAQKLQLLLPGMNAAPGTGNGYLGSPEEQTTGIPFNVIVNAVDNDWNLVAIFDQVSLSSSDQLANLPLPVNLVNGTATLSITLNSGGLYSITAHNDSDPGVNSATSPPVKLVKIDYFALSPIGDPFGGIPGQVNVGENINNVEISARNNDGDIVTKYNGRVYLSELTDAGPGRMYPEVIQLDNGRWNGNLAVFRAGEKRASWGVTGDVWIKATDEILSSDQMEIIIACDDRFNLWVNGEYIGGNSHSDTSHTYIVPRLNGKNVIAVHGIDQKIVGGLIAEVRIGGVVVYRTDRYWLSTSNFETNWADLNFDDSGWSQVDDLGEYGEVLPWVDYIYEFPPLSQAHWIWGEADVNYFRGSFYLDEGSLPSPPSYSSHTGVSNRFCAVPNQFEQLLTVLPGESYLPGSRSGRTGLPTDQLAGEQFLVDIYATDKYKNLISDVSDVIAMTSSDPAANLPFNQVMSNGTASMNITLNTHGLQTVTASDVSDGNILPHTSRAVKVLELIDHFVISSISSPQSAGQGFQVTITAVDHLGVPAVNFSGYIDLTTSLGLHTISPDEIYIVNGIWTGNVMVTKAESFVTLSVQDRTNPPHTGSSNQFNVNPGPTSKLQVLLPGENAVPGIAPGKSGSVSDILAGSTITVRVNAVDDWWNITTNSTHVVRLASSDPLVLLPSDGQLSSGTRQFIVTLNTTGLQTISAFDQTIPQITPGFSSEIRVNPGNLDRFVFNPVSGPKFAGIPFPVSITAVDLQGNPVPQYSGLVSLSASTGDGTIVPVTANFINGSWMGNLTLKKASGGVFLTAADNASPPHSGTSNEFEVKAGSLASFQVIIPGLSATPGVAPGYSGTPQAQNVGHPFPVIINGVDAYWNVATTANDSFGIASTDVSASLPLPAKLNNGTKNLSITLNEDGSHTISAFHLSNSQIQNGQTPLITVLPQNLDHFTFNQIAGPAVVGQSMEITVFAETVENERVFSFEGNVYLSASNGVNMVFPAVIGPFIDGEWTGGVILTRADNEVTLTVSDEGTPAHTGSSNTFAVHPGEFKKLQILLPGESALPGSPEGKTGLSLDQQTGAQFDVTIGAVDEYWNRVSLVEDSLRILSSDSLSIISEMSKLINGTATSTVIMGSAGRHTITAEDITDIQKLAGISSVFNVNPGNLDHFIFQTITEQTAGTEFFITITAVDIASNPVAGFNGHARLQSTTGNGTYSPNEIDFVNGEWTGKLFITKAFENVQLTCLDFAAVPHSGQSNTFKVTAGEFTRLQILLPGETGTPGVTPGKTGEVETQTAGDAIIISINAVDNWWNSIPTATGTVGVTSTDNSANLPLDAVLTSGMVVFNDMRFTTPGFWTVTAHNRSDPTISSDTSPLVHVITGSVASFTFDPIYSPQIAGDTINISVRAVDGSGTSVSNYQEMASMTASTGAGTIIIGEVQFTNGVWQGPVILTKAVQSLHLNIHDFADVVRGNSNPFTLLPGSLAGLQVLLPGETAAPGLIQAKNGAPNPQIVGIPFQITVNAIDVWSNQVVADSLNLHFFSSDSIADLPENQVQTSSSANYTVTMLTTGNSNISVQTTNFPELIDTSSELIVQSGDLDHFVFSIIDSNQVAGHPFTVKIEAYNKFDFPVTHYEGDIILSASTGNGTLSKTGVTLVNGFWQGELAVFRADSDLVLYAGDYVPPPNTHTGYSNTFTVVHDNLAGLQVILPGQTYTPGVAPGHKGEPLSRIAGIFLNVLVRGVDSYWNLVPDRDDTLTVTVSDSFAIIPELISLTDGYTEIPVTFRAAGEHLVCANFVNGPILTKTESDTLHIYPSNFTQLLLLLPGEQILPGDFENDPVKTPGKMGDAVLQTSGLPFVCEVLAVDDFWNPVTNTPQDRIRLFVTDNLATITPVDTLLLAGKTSFSVTLIQGGNQVIRALNDSNVNIRSSMDAVIKVLLGGLHYEIKHNVTKIAAGEEFDLEIYYKNGINEIVPSANHIVHLNLVAANTIDQVAGSVKNASFNLQNGQKTVKQICTIVGLVRIKVVDEIGTVAAYSDPFELFAGAVAAIQLNAGKTEIRGLENIFLTTILEDAAGNAVANQEVQFYLQSGSGELKNASALSNSDGAASVEFIGGKVAETNIVRAQIDSIYTDIEIIVNLTPTSTPDGVPVNYPNPFGLESPVTYIDYYLSEDADVTLQIYDLFGNLVWSKHIKAGTPGGVGRADNSHPNSVIWTGINDKGQKVGNGGYILIANAAVFGKTIMNARRKIAVLR